MSTLDAPLLSEVFVEGLRASADAPTTFMGWSQQVPEPKTGPLRFDVFPFQPTIYEEFGTTTRQIVVRKGTQLGMSALTSRWALYEAERNGRTILYVFPTKGDVFDYADARVQPMLERSEYLAARVGNPNNKGLRRIGVGLVYFRGSQDKHALDSVDADGLALDEYDTLNQANIPDAERRLSSVLSAGLIRRIGVPSLPEYGISAKYDESTRQKWLVQCECGHLGIDQETHEPLRTPPGRGWQEIDFWQNVDQRQRAIVCAGCGEPLDVAKGRWIPQQPDGEWPGYHVSRLIVPGIQVGEIIKASRLTSAYEVEVFHQKDLGLPYLAKDARLSPEEIAAAQREGIMQQPGYVGAGLVTMGVDVASERALNARISEHLDEQRKRTLLLTEVNDFNELSLLMDRYGVHMCGIDHQPETRLARAFAARFHGRVYLIDPQAQMTELLKVDDMAYTCRVRRTELYDATVEMIRRQRNLLPLDLPDGYVSHMTANIRRVIVDQLGRKRTLWQATRADDYMQCEAYDLMAAELFYRRLAVEVAQTPVFQQLDEMVDLERSEVGDLDSLAYRPGPDEDYGTYGG